MDLKLVDILAARQRIAPYIRRTPLAHSPALSGRVGLNVRLKLESAQVTHSFKARGAVNAALAFLTRAGAAAARDQVLVTASAGNHGRALAYAAERLGLRLVVFTRKEAPRAKLDPIARHGADLRAVAATYEETESLAREFAAREQAVYVSPYDHADVIAGAGTVALEIIEEWPSVDAIVVPVGGGGLISGVALAAKAVASDMEVIGIEAAASPAFVSALAAGRVVTVDVRPTIADGLAGNMDPESRTFGYVKALVDRVALATEPSLEEAVRVLASCDHVIAEGAGGAGVAGLLEGLRPRGRNVAVVVSGANIDVNTLTRALTVPRPEAETPRSATGSP